MDNDPLNALWLHMLEAFGGRWSQYGLTPNDTWRAALEPFQPHEIAHATGAILADLAQRSSQGREVYPPSVAEFVGFLLRHRAECQGVPILADAWTEANAHCHDVEEHRWSHDAVRAAGERVGWYSIRHAVPSPQSVQKRFAEVYSECVRLTLAGESLTLAAPAIEQETAPVARIMAPTPDPRPNQTPHDYAMQCRADVLAWAQNQKDRTRNRFKRYFGQPRPSVVVNHPPAL